MNRSRYVLQSYEDTYFCADGEAIKTTSIPEEATTFVDMDVAFQRAQALMTVGYFVKQVVSLRCAISITGKPVYQAQVFF